MNPYRPLEGITRLADLAVSNREAAKLLSEEAHPNVLVSVTTVLVRFPSSHSPGRSRLPYCRYTRTIG